MSEALAGRSRGRTRGSRCSGRSSELAFRRRRPAGRGQRRPAAWPTFRQAGQAAAWTHASSATPASSVSPITLGSWPMSGDRYGAIDDSEAVKTIRARAGAGHHQLRHRARLRLGPRRGDARRGAGRPARRRRRHHQVRHRARGPSGQPGRDSSRASILREIDDSLRRLRTDHVDVYLVHWPDPNTPLEETMADTGRDPAGGQDAAGRRVELRRAAARAAAWRCGRSTCCRLATTCSIGAWSARCFRSAASTTSA